MDREWTETILKSLILIFQRGSVRAGVVTSAHKKSNKNVYQIQTLT